MEFLVEMFAMKLWISVELLLEALAQVPPLFCSIYVLGDNLFCNGIEKCDVNGNCVGIGDPCANGPTCSNACNETSDNCYR